VPHQQGVDQLAEIGKKLAYGKGKAPTHPPRPRPPAAQAPSW
jgi:hypothetical protein